MNKIRAYEINIVVYEPMLAEELFYNSQIINALADFKSQCDIIVANRIDVLLNDVIEKIYTRNLFKIN